MAKRADAEVKQFPSTLYVTRETDNQGDTIGFTTDYAPENIDEDKDGGLVGVYSLVRVDRLTVTKKLAPR